MGSQASRARGRKSACGGYFIAVFSPGAMMYGHYEEFDGNAVLKPEHALEIARQRSIRRNELVSEIRETLRRWASEGIELGHFDHGAFFIQLGHEINTVKIDLGDTLQADRRFRKKVRPKLRRRCFRRDDWTCQTCGWQGPKNEAERIAAASADRRTLTLDHIIPQSDGGPTTIENLVTSCTACNNAKGNILPEM